MDHTGGALICKDDPTFNRITKYIQQMPASGFKGEMLCLRLRTDDGCHIFSPFFAPTLDPLDRFECRVGLSYAHIMCEYTGLRTEITIFVPLGEDREIRITNVHDNSLNVDAILSYLHIVHQIVILGAGWDTRAYNLAKKEGVHVLKVDSAETQTQKRQVLDEAKIDSSKVVFATTDFEQEFWLAALKRVGFNPEKPTFIL